VTEGDRFEREFAHFIDAWRGDAELSLTGRGRVAANRSSTRRIDRRRRSRRFEPGSRAHQACQSRDVGYCG